jgi:hypothetical protein
MPFIHRIFPVAPLLVVALAACGNGTGGDTTSSGGTGGQTTTSSGPSLCADDARVTPYAAGLSAASADGKVKVTFASSMPSPPAKGQNSWLIDLADALGAPIDGATVTLKPFMPDHGHGASVVPTVKAGSKPGEYAVTDIELFMPGVWQNTFTVTPSGGAAEAVVFTFCVDG